MILAIDFDGTIVEHRYPEVGKPVPHATYWMQQFQAVGAKLILWTMRCDGGKDGPVLTDAVEYCRRNGIEFYGVNRNPNQQWSKSPKAYAHRYIDDAAVGCPLIKPADGGRPYVDWDAIGPKILGLIEGSFD